VEDKANLFPQAQYGNVLAILIINAINI